MASRPFDRRLVYNTYIVASEPWFKGQNGFLGRAAGGWAFAPIFTAGSGPPVYCNTWTDAQSWGAGDGSEYFDNEQCVFTSQYKGGHSAHFGVAGDAATGGGNRNVGHTGEHIHESARGLEPGPRADSRHRHQEPRRRVRSWASLTGTWMDRSRRMSALQSRRPSSSRSSQPTCSTTGSSAIRALALYAPGSWGVLNGQANSPRAMEFGGRVTF